MDDMVIECKKKVARFRIKELKDILGQLGLVRTGRKQDLMDRVLALLSGEEASLPRNKFIGKEEVAKIIDDTYRKVQHTGATDSGTGGHCVSDTSNIMPTEEIVDQKVRCPCGNPLKTEFMIQCADPECNVLQHIPCVIVPEEPLEGIPSAPSRFHCELCRINRSDPFLKTLGHPLYPSKLLVLSSPVDGSQPLQNVETSFQITRADVHLLERGGHDLQAWCILLNDSVPFRMQWPQYPDLRVNGIPVKTISRPGSKMLGANGRDDGPSISMYIVEGYNKISLTSADTRSFCLGVRLVKQRTIQQVVSLIPSEEEGESFTDALARVCRCIGGGMAATNEDSDSDLEVIADNVTINLRCPMSGSRMKTAIRFNGCIHLGCFDLDTFIQINQRSKKWQCPICLKNYSLEDIVIDPYLNRIVKMMHACEEDVNEIEVKSDGTWRAKSKHPFMNLEQWHLPDGSLCISEVKVDSNVQVPSESKHHLAIRENGNGLIPQDLQPSRNQLELEDYLTNNGQEIISMSSSSEDEREGLQSINKNAVMDSNKSSSSSLRDPSVIVLSDDDEDNENMVSSSGVSITGPRNDLEASVTQLEDAVQADVKAESSQTNNNKRSGDPFTFFPRLPRSARRQRPRVDVEGD